MCPGMYYLRILFLSMLYYRWKIGRINVLATRYALRPMLTRVWDADIENLVHGLAPTFSRPSLRASSGRLSAEFEAVEELGQRLQRLTQDEAAIQADVSGPLPIHAALSDAVMLMQIRSRFWSA